MHVPDNYDAFVKHEADQEEKMARLPVCDYCGNAIQDDWYYEIDGEKFCPDCMDEHFRKSTDDFIRGD